MKKTAIFLLLLIVLGNIYFRDAFQWIWIVLGFGFFAFCVSYEISEDRKNKKLRMNKQKGS